MIDWHNARPALCSFVLPGGSRGAAMLHIARSIMRRAEREIVEVAFQEPITSAVIRYMNRLSELLFVLARIENLRVGCALATTYSESRRRIRSQQIGMNKVEPEQLRGDRRVYARPG